MSFILDALKKSESDRQRQSGPALFEVKVAPPKARFPVWALAIVALLVVNMLIVGWMLLRRSSHNDGTAATAPAAGVPAAAPATSGQPNSVGPVPSPAAASAAISAPTPGPGYASAQAGDTRPSDRNQGEPTLAGNPRETGSRETGSREPGGRDVGAARDANGANRFGNANAGRDFNNARDPASSNRDVGNSRDSSDSHQFGNPGNSSGSGSANANMSNSGASASPGPGPGSGADAPANPDDYAPATDPGASLFKGHVRRGTESGLMLYQDMAVVQGANLPQLRLDLHVYAAKPQDRFALINMHKLHEGDSLPDGVRVESITPDGVIMSHNGSKFLLPRE